MLIMAQRIGDYIWVMCRITVWKEEFPELCKNKIKQQIWWSKDVREFDLWPPKDQGQAAHLPSPSLQQLQRATNSVEMSCLAEVWALPELHCVIVGL